MLVAGSAELAGAEPTEEDCFALFAASNENYIQAVAKGDVDGIMRHYAIDAIQTPPGAKQMAPFIVKAGALLKAIGVLRTVPGS